jgi:hypothetical protein
MMVRVRYTIRATNLGQAGQVLMATEALKHSSFSTALNQTTVFKQAQVGN